jgi:ADP-ribose pyrophosphatase
MNEMPEVTESQRIFEGRIFNLRIDRVRYADGTGHRFDIVEHRGSLAVIAATGEGKIVLVRQYRHAIGRMLWELPAGVAEPGEDPVAGAARELQEETGYRAGRIRQIAQMVVTPGISNELLTICYATELTAGPQHLDGDERIEAGIFTLGEAWELVHTGQANDAKTVLALLWLATNRGEIGADFGR